MVYLDDDPTKSDAQIQTLVYTVYNCTTGQWTAPAPIQDDAAGDFMPCLTDAGDSIFVSWVSSDPANVITDITSSEDAVSIAQATDIYGTFINKSAMIAAANGGTVTEGVTYTIDRITDDSAFVHGIMDLGPSAVYDPNAGTAGQTFIFYLKDFATTTTMSDYADSIVSGDSVICYRIYDHASGTWMTDYYDGEMTFSSAEDRDEYIYTWYGQRFLYGPVSGSDLPVSDITTCLAYKNHILFAYTVDMDGNTDDDTDRELFVQLYDTAQHKLFYPIRITNNDYSDAMPRLISNAFPHLDGTDGEELDRSAYLFWVADAGVLMYIDVVDLIRHGIVVDGNGALKSDYTISPIIIQLAEDGERDAQLNDYEIFTDNNDDLYVLRAITHTEEGTELGENEMPAKEIYASAMIRFKDTDAVEQLDAITSVAGPAASLLTTSGGAIVFYRDDDTYYEDPYYETASVLTRYLVTDKWSDPVRITGDGKTNDNMSAVVTADGKLYILHNQYTVTCDPEKEDTYQTSDIDLMLTVCDPVSSVEVTSFTLSDDTPNPGDVVTVTAEVTNTGLTTAKGYSAKFYAVKGSSMTAMSVLPNGDGIDYQKVWLAPGTSHIYEFNWTVPANFEGTKFCCLATENGYSDQNISYSDPVEKKPVYTPAITGITQDGKTFTATISVENTGNAASAAGDKLTLELACLYGSRELIYGINDKFLATCSLDNLEVGECRTYSVDFTVPESVFEYCGYDQLNVAVTDADNNGLTGIYSRLLVLTEPLNFSDNNKSVTLGIGGAYTPEITNGNDSLDMCDTFMLASDDNSIATVENGVIKGVGKGTTTVRVRSVLYGNEAEIAVTVTGSTYEPPAETPAEEEFEFPFVDVTEDDYYYDAVAWAVKNNITSGTDATHFSPMSICTRAQMVTFLWNASGQPEPRSTVNPFTDVRDTNYFYKAVLWAYENGITAGTSKDKFSPDKIVNRAQAVTFLANMAGVKAASGDYDHDFVDVKATDYYDAAVGWAYENDITAGTGHGKFSPTSDCLRYQIIMFLYKYFN